ncbi:MAG: hypothetical protein IJS13_01260 [Paludibacteraceae bacterium]|nr:hypothetical protein [Paludibacteraceae bacterium]
MKRLFILIVACISVSLGVYGQRSCATAMSIDSAFNVALAESDTFWFSAWTYDLPLSIDFAPVNASNTHTPSAVLDFTCTPGVYDDPKLSELFSGGGNMTIEMPYALKFDSVVENGQKIYNITVDKSFRNIFTIFGINHDVQAFVKVFFPEGGQLKVLPDSLFRGCEAYSHRVELGDTIFVGTNDTNVVYILPYGEWKNDSIRYVWKGTNEKPLRVWLSNIDCDFNLSLLDVGIWDMYDIASGSKYKLTKDDIQSQLDRVDEETGGGLFYARLQTDGAGMLIVERVPEFEPADGTIPLEYDTPLNLSANDTNKVYYITRDEWQKSLMFTSSSTRRMHAYLMKSANAVLSDADSRVLAVYDFDDAETGTELTLLGNEMKNLWSKTTDMYMYIRFRAERASTVTASEWTPGTCEKNSTARFFMGNPVRVANGANSLHYLLRYDDFAGDTLFVSWTGNNTLAVYLVDTCAGYAVTASNKHISKRNKNLSAGGSAYFTPEETASWEGMTDSDGWFYVRLTPRATGDVTFRTSKAKNDGSDPVTPEPPSPGDDEEPQPLIPQPFTPDATIACDCSDLDMRIFVTEEQDLRLYDNHGKLVDSWHQTPSDPPHTYTPVCGVQYVLKGKTNTVRIVR